MRTQSACDSLRGPRANSLPPAYPALYLSLDGLATLAPAPTRLPVQTSVVFVLPTTYPITPGSANYTAPLIVAVLALAAVLFYAPGFGGRQWFTGPAPNLE